MGITFGARDGGSLSSALGCTVVVVVDSVDDGILAFLLDGIATEM